MNYSHGKIWPKIKEELYKKYNIIDWLDVLGENLDIEVDNLYQRLLPYSNASFQDNQRIIIYHRDTDYYYSLDTSGFFMHNLYKVMQYLNLPSEYVILISAFPTMNEESDRLATEFNIPPMKIIYCPYQWCPPPEQVVDLDTNIKNIQKPYVCLNGLQRTHRMYTLCLLKEFNIFDKGIISLGPKHYSNQTQTQKNSNNTIELPQHLPLCQCNPATRINERLILKSHQWSIMNKWYCSFKPFKCDLIEGNPNEDSTRYQPNFLQYAFWNIVLETVGEYPHTFMTEKTVKSILTKRPFVILGGKSPIKNLKYLGFKTFNNWIDEEYDELDTFADRSEHCILQIKKFCNFTPQQLQKIAQEMQEVLEYNFYHYKNIFGKSRLDDLILNRL